MKLNSLALKTLLGLFISIVGMMSTWILADEPKKNEKTQNVVVRSDDIGVHTVIHGKLGLPLGRLATIQGRCVTTENRKEYADRSTLRIEQVDGVALDRPFELLVEPFGPSDRNELKVGSAYELRGYEHGQFHGVPADAYKEYARDGRPEFATMQGYVFRTEFVFLSRKQL